MAQKTLRIVKRHVARCFLSEVLLLKSLYKAGLQNSFGHKPLPKRVKRIRRAIFFYVTAASSSAEYPGNSVPSDDVYYLSEVELDQLKGWDPATGEWTASKCSDQQLSQQERSDLRELFDSGVGKLTGLEQRYFESLLEKKSAYETCRFEVLKEAQIARMGN